MSIFEEYGAFKGVWIHIQGRQFSQINFSSLLKRGLLYKERNCKLFSFRVVSF